MSAAENATAGHLSAGETRRRSTARTILPVALAVAFSAAVEAHAIVACDGDAVRAISGCVGFSSCVVTEDILCDTSCGAECVYEFPSTERPILRGVFRSAGPPMRFVANLMAVLGPGGSGIGGTGRGTALTSVPGIETVPGGFIGLEVTNLEITRPICAPAGIIEVTGGRVESAAGAETYRYAMLDVSGETGGGTIRFLSGGFKQISLLARGLGTNAPGGAVIHELRGAGTLNYEGRRHRIDVSGESGGTVVWGTLQRQGDIRANGRTGDGGTVLLESLEAGSGIVLGGCTDRRSGRIRVDSRRGKGGSFTVRVAAGAEICQKIEASGREGGGSVTVEAGEIRFRRIEASGKRRGPGGTVRLIAAELASGQIGSIVRRPYDRIDVRGAPGGTVEVRGDDGASVTEILADATKADAAAGTVLIGEVNDPPLLFTNGQVRKRIWARSKEGPGGKVTLRGCDVGGVFQSPVQIRAEGGTTGGEVLLQSKGEMQLPTSILAQGLGASIRIEYATLLLGGESLVPTPEIVQYPNPNCDCTMSFAECMTPP